MVVHELQIGQVHGVTCNTQWCACHSMIVVSSAQTGSSQRNYSNEDIILITKLISAQLESLSPSDN